MSQQKGSWDRKPVDGKRLRRFAKWPAALLFLLSSTSSAQPVCVSRSIDWVPYFIGQTYYDVLNRAPDTTGQISYITALESLNTTKCKSANPVLSAGSCEWNNNAQTILDFLASRESISKHGTLSNNVSFVTALYRLLLHETPSAAALNQYSLWLRSGASRLNVVLSLLSGSQYRQRFACTSKGTANPSCNGAESVDSVPSFISQSWLDILGRPADSAEHAWWTAYTTANQQAMCRNASASAFSICDRVLEAQTALSLFNSSEYKQSNPPITASQALGELIRQRLPRARFFVPYNLSQYANNFINSVNSGFVTALYTHLLRSAPDAAGLAYYTNYLNATNDRVGTVYAFLTNKKYRSRFACYAGVRDKLNFGINGHPFNSLAYSNSLGISFSTQMSLVQNAGLTWYRANVPTAGGDYSQMDLLLSTAQAAGIKLLPVIIPDVNLGSDTPAEAYSKSYSDAFKIVTRYKSSIRVWELWNEADVYSNRGWAYNGQVISDYDPTRLALAVAILHGLADGARAADPGCLRIINFGWVHTGLIEALENDGVPYDIVGIHWYANSAMVKAPAMGDITCPGQNLPCPSQPNFSNLITQLLPLTNGKPLWLTENNYWPLIPSNSVSTNVAWEQDYLPSMLQRYLSLRSVYPYQVVMIYELLDEPDVPGGAFHTQMGLYQVTESNGGYKLGEPKTVFQSVQQILASQ